jgi:thiosulfate dehydrogenase (quinone) large subunit
VSRPSVPAIALLPLRFFCGATFLYAGLTKLLDPTFLDATAPGSLHAQLEAFARGSPLGALIAASLPLTTLIGITIAVAEIGIGVGALSGLAFRVAAWGGAALSLLLWLTASWTVQPYYLGPDLPYLAGWLTLALAGHGGLLVPTAIRRLGEAPPARPPGGRRAARRARRGPAAGEFEAARAAPTVASPERRLLLQAGLLAVAAAAIASASIPLRALGVWPAGGPGTPPGSPNPSGPGTGSPAPSGPAGPTATPAAGGSGLPVATIADVQRAGAAAFTIPFDAPSPLPAGDPGVVVQLADGSFVAFDAICTHAGCTVEWDATDAVLLCPCHLAAFDPAHGAAVLQGPARRPLASLPIVVDQAAGEILLAG